MTKRRGSRKKSRQSGGPAINTQPSLQPSPEELTQEQILAKLDEAREQALSMSPQMDIEKLTVGQPPAEIDLAECWRKAEEARQLFDMQHQQAEVAEREAEAQKKHYTDLETALEKGKTKLEAERRRLSAQQQDVKETQERLADQTQWLARLKEQEKQFRDDLLTLTKEAADQTANALLDLTAHLAELRSDCQTQMAAQTDAHVQNLLKEQKRIDGENEKLVKGQIELAKQQRHVLRERLEVEADREMLDEDRESLGRLVSQQAGAELERLQRERDSYKKLHEDALVHNTELQSALDNREIADRRFGDRTPDDVLRELEALRSERDKLDSELTSRPTQAEMERLKKLDADRESWENRRWELEQQVQEQNKLLSSHRIGVVDLENLRDQSKAFEASRQILQKRLEDLRADVALEVAAGSQRAPFPSCLAMDEDQKLRTQPEDTQVRESVSNLAAFVEKVQQRIGYDPGTKTELYYSLEDIRSFLAGLSMSYLTIIQGISGTGKTSLPRAFARALGGECVRIEVQAGWRDRYDLIGHYNSFERTWYESEFLQALYKAQCPANSDRLFIILLDEMNLSYPEQYFADVISALEDPSKSEWKLKLMPTDVPMAPERFVDNGRNLRIPHNLRFVGTANQDETTKDFADKTYDRAHIIELPITRSHFPLKKDLRDPPMVSFSGLQKAFEEAKKKHASSAARCFQLLEGDLRKTLGSRFGIGWGHRLKEQLSTYVPVVIASGGSAGEALDYVLAMKVLRKARELYEPDEDEFNQLKESLLSTWNELNDPSYSEPLRSAAVIDEELHRLRRLRVAQGLETP